MSIDLNWETVTTGPDGIVLAEKIRSFIHERFQTVTLPRFIKSVKVHAFEFGSIAPEIELKDICDPLPDFYEEDDDDAEAEEDEREDEVGWQPPRVPLLKPALSEQDGGPTERPGRVDRLMSKILLCM